MTDKRIQESARPAYKIYELIVQGTLEEDWQDWFNGMLLVKDLISEGNASTTLTCKVRDQAELVGIINWLHEMNMVIEKVCLVPLEPEPQEDQNKNI